METDLNFPEMRGAMTKKLWAPILLIVVAGIVPTFAAPFDLTAEPIKDSASLLQKIKQIDDPMYPYFSKGKTPATRADLITVINEKILPNPSFAFETTQLDELKTTDRFENLSSEKQEEILARNRDLLTELYPAEIAPRDKNAVKQTVGLKLSVKHAENAIWLKAEIMQFLNEIVGNEKVMSNWRNLTMFFDSSVAVGDLEAFTEELKMFNKLKLPVNSISVQQKKNTNEADVLIDGKNDRQQIKFFTVSTAPGKKWKILQVANISSRLQQAGYIVHKEVRK